MIDIRPTKSTREQVRILVKGCFESTKELIIVLAIFSGIIGVCALLILYWAYILGIGIPVMILIIIFLSFCPTKD